MKSILLFPLVLITALVFAITGPQPASAGPKVLIVQSVMIPLYEEVLEGFKSVCCEQDLERLVVQDQTLSDVARKVSETKPVLIVTIGVSALNKVKEIEGIPIVFCMVLNSPDNPHDQSGAVTGVSMNIPQDYQLRTFAEALPRVKTIGLLYDPRRSGSLVEKASAAARDLGITLFARQVASPKEVAPTLESMKGTIDSFWMLPDMTVINDVTVEHMLSFAVSHRIPILTFSDKYVEQGALMSISIDTFDVGAQTGEMALKLLSGLPPREVPFQEARKGLLSINLKVARKLNITIDEQVIKKAVIIE